MKSVGTSHFLALPKFLIYRPNTDIVNRYYYYFFLSKSFQHLYSLQIFSPNGFLIDHFILTYLCCQYGMKDDYSKV
jgi:hypothetical protein